MKKKLIINSESRDANFDTYNRFTFFEPILYGNEKYNPPLQITGSIRYQSFPYKSYAGIDPTALLFPHSNNLSWKRLDGLETLLEESHLIGITDSYYFWNLQASQFARKKNIPIYTILWCNIPHHITSWFPPYSWITQSVINSTELFILRNNKAYEFTDSLNIPREKTKVIYPGIKVEKYHHQQHKNDSLKIKILYVGALTKAKGIEILLHAFAKLCKEYKNCELHLVGSGPLFEQCAKAAQELPIHLHGQLPYSQLPEIYASADIFCSPSQTSTVAGMTVWHEYFSYTLLEAQASSLPIISTNTGGISEEILSENYLIQEKNSDQLHKALRELVNDPAKRMYLGKLNRAYAESKYNNTIQAELLETALRKLV